MAAIVPNIIERSFPVTGMSCAACALGVENALKAAPGVAAAAVNFAAGTAAVTWDPRQTNPEALQQAVQAGGYDLVVAAAPEEALAQAEAAQEAALQDLRRRMWVAALLGLPLMIIGMAFMHWHAGHYVMWALATPILAYSGSRFYVQAIRQARHLRANMDTLVALSTAIAYIFSVFNVLFPGFWISRGLEPHVYFEASGVIVAFVLVGKYMEERAKAGTSNAIRGLMGLQPQQVLLVLPDGSTQSQPIGAVRVGDLLRVRPGDKVPVDGKVQSGHSAVDESLASGEPIPVDKTAGDTVLAGTLNQSGILDVRAERVGEQTMLAQIIRQVQSAMGSKPPVQQLVDRVVAVFVPVVMSIALLSGFIWMVWGGENGFSQGLMAAVTVLVIACPCALGLATPTAITVGLGRAAQLGVLIRDAQALEAAKRVNRVLLDKTGTLTEGKPSVVDIRWAAAADVAALAPVLRALQARSTHPLAVAIAAHLRDAGVAESPVAAVQNLPGLGLTAMALDRTWYVGKPSWLASLVRTQPQELAQALADWEAQGHTVVAFGDADGLQAVIALAYRLKPSAATAVAALNAQGITVEMLTGDHAGTAQVVAAQAGIQDWRAGLLPRDKAEAVKALQAQGQVVAMVGDGINDAEALALADLSVAMGHGADVAMDVAQMTIVQGDLTRLAQAIRLSAATVGTIRQNLFWAFIYNVIGIPIAAGLLYPINGFTLNPMIASAAMALSSVSVVSNSLRLRFRKI